MPRSCCPLNFPVRCTQTDLWVVGVIPLASPPPHLLVTPSAPLMSFSAVLQSSIHPPSLICISPTLASAMSQGIPSFLAFLGSPNGFLIPRTSAAASCQHMFVSSSKQQNENTEAESSRLSLGSGISGLTSRWATTSHRNRIGSKPKTNTQTPNCKPIKETIMHGQGLPKNQFLT